MERFDEIIPALFLDAQRLSGRYEPPEHETFEPMPGSNGIWQGPVFPHDADVARLLRIYLLDTAGKSILQAQWRNEARSLLRLSSSGHPALPQLHEANLVKDHRFGYLILDDPGEPVTPAHPLHALLGANRGLAFQRWVSLLEAVMLVHDEAMIHRSLTPLATCARGSAEAVVVLDGFQMSAFVSTWLRGGRADDATSVLEALDAEQLACLAPERLGPQCGLRRRFVESFRTDVFGLGMIGACWLTGAPAGWADGFDIRRYTEEKHREVVSALRGRLLQSGLPRPLRSLLENMISFEPSGRIPSGRAAYEEATRLYGPVLREFEEPHQASASAHRVYYLRETMDRLYSDQRTRSHPSIPDYTEYAEVLARDLDGAAMTWSPSGFDPWEPKKKDEKTRMARVVFLGREYAYFAQYLEQGINSVEKRALVIKYVIPAHQARELRRQPKMRALPHIEARFLEGGRASRMTRPLPAAAPSWEDHVSSIDFVDPQGPAAPIVRAANWLLGAQRALSAAREYRYERQTGEPTRIVLQEHAEPGLPPVDTEDGAFLSLYLGSRLRRPMGRRFESVSREATEQGEATEFLLRTEWNGRDDRLRLTFEKRLDDQTVQFVSMAEGALVPKIGYVRPGDAGMYVTQSRQRTALRILEQRHHHLAAQLAAPVAIELKLDAPPQRLGLDDATHTLVQQILETWPLFVLQGPPGTGKTFVARHTIAAVLASDPFARILVSAQSHHALDNLLEAVVERPSSAGGVNAERILLRMASERTQEKVGGGQVDSLAQRCLPANVVRTIVEALQKPAVGGVAGSELSKLAKQWRALALKRRLDADLAQRLVRSASVVFATSAGSGTNEVRGTRGAAAYDWVIIEEAARGWFTEMLVPLVQGTRWLLIGDHVQLPAFQAREITALLDKDVESGTTASATGFTADASWKSFFRYFEHLMSAPVHRGIRSQGVLQVQRRMHPDIAELVRTSYYPNQPLDTHPDAKRPHGFRMPTFLERTALVWIDTSSLGMGAQERHEGEGVTNRTEVDIVRALLSRLQPQPKVHDAKIPALVLLSPYKAQVKILRERVQEAAKEAVHTVDSVQGRQAETVIVSLVRNNAENDENAAIGFLAEPERANVMFSRARRLLVVVGSLAHFERFGHTHWGRVVAYVRAMPRFLIDAARDLDFEVSKS